MSELKFSPNEFLEKVELDRFLKFIDTDGFRNFLIQNSDEFGLIRKENEIFTNALVQEDIGLTIKINPIKAIDSNGKLISSKATSLLAIPSDSNWYWVKIAYKTTNEETGTFSIDSSGNLVCTSGDAELLKIFRGQPNYPTRITFINGVSNTLEYDVEEVIDNNNATLTGSFTGETDLKIAIIGTFTNGYVPLESEKFIFNYDSCVVSLVLSNTVNPPTHTTGLEFFIGRVKNNGVVIKVEDKRNEIWKVDSNYFLHKLEVSGNPLIGVEQITYDDVLSPKESSILQLAWAFRSSTFTVNLKLNTITISSGSGGKFKTTNFSSLFTDGDFDGWRLYVKTGEYYKIKTSSLIASNIELVMENISSDKFFSDVNSTTIISQELVITPDAEEIEFICVADPASTNLIVDKKFTFPINEASGKIKLNVYSSTTTLYNLKYRYKHIKDYSPSFILPDDSEGFYNELQFDSNGNLIGSPTRTPYTSDSINGYIPLKLHPDAYSAFENRIDLGDKLGVDTSTLTNATPLVELIVGDDKQYQFFSDGDQSVSNDAITLSADMFIDLNKLNVNGDNCRNGNYFLLHFKQKITFNGFSLRIVTDYVSSVDFTLIKLFDKNDEYFLTTSEQGIFIRVEYTGANWIINSTNEVPKIQNPLAASRPSQSAPGATTSITVVFNTVLSDDDGILNVSNGRFIPPKGLQKIIFSCVINPSTTPTGNYTAAIFRNGVSFDNVTGLGRSATNDPFPLQFTYPIYSNGVAYYTIVILSPSSTFDITSAILIVEPFNKTLL